MNHPFRIALAHPHQSKSGGQLTVPSLPSHPCLFIFPPDLQITAVTGLEPIMEKNRARYTLSRTCLGNPLHLEVETEKYCVYCQFLRAPTFLNPVCPAGAAYCSHPQGLRSLVLLNETCPQWAPPEQVPPWLSRGYLQHTHAAMPPRPWYTPFDDGADGEAAARGEEK